MNIFITLLENVNKSRTSANNLSLTVVTIKNNLCCLVACDSGFIFLRWLTPCKCEVKIPKLTEIDRLAVKLNLSSIKTQRIKSLVRLV
jgi:hypothetical protein